MLLRLVCASKGADKVAPLLQSDACIPFKVLHFYSEIKVMFITKWLKLAASFAEK